MIAKPVVHVNISFLFVCLFVAFKFYVEENKVYHFLGPMHATVVRVDESAAF